MFRTLGFIFRETVVYKLIVTEVEQRKKLEGFNDDGESW
jgi:hypothetical protein